MEHTTTIETRRGKVPAWSQLFLVAILVALFGGAFWLNSRPKPAISSSSARTESAESLRARGIQAHSAGSLDAAIDLYDKVLQRDPAHPAAHSHIAQNWVSILPASFQMSNQQCTLLPA